MENSNNIGKYFVKARNTHQLVIIYSIEKIDERTEIFENDDDAGRFDPYFLIFDTEEEVISWIYEEKKYISMESAKEIFDELLEVY